MNERKDEVKRRLKAQQARWMQERAVATDVEEIREERRMERRGQNAEDGPSDNNTAINEDLLNRLTAKISDRLKVQLAKDASSSGEDIESKMESFLSAELHTHSCQICFELMAPPRLSPTLLFPCGHTFCKQCVDKCKDKCPYCRARIESRAENHSLKQLIERFAGKKWEEEKTGGEDAAEEKKVDGREARRLKSEYERATMRYEILKNELGDSEQALRDIVSRKVGVRKTRDFLKGEKERVLEELRLCDEHLQEQEKKWDQVIKDENTAIKAIDIVKSTLSELHLDVEKKRILATGCEGGEENLDPSSGLLFAGDSKLSSR